MPKQIALIALAAILSACDVTPTYSPLATPAAAIQAAAYPEPITALAGPIYRLYLPGVASVKPFPALGVEVASRRRVAQAVPWLERLTEGRRLYTRLEISWAEIEPAPGILNWIPADDAAFARLSAAGADAILVLLRTPEWALADPAYKCGPIDPAYWPAWATFAAAAVARYSQPPYNVRIFELWNEPDAPIDPTDKGWGCWGDPTQADYGGSAYGQAMLAAVEAIRAQTPGVTLLSGGLMVGCTVTGQYCGSGPSTRFLAGMKAAGLLDAVDGVAWHGYGGWYGNPDQILTATYFVYKANTLRQYTDKPLWLTEMGFLCRVSDAECKTETYENIQAAFVPIIADACRAEEWHGCIWYSLMYNGWMYADLFNRDGTPRSAYWALLNANSH